MQKAIIYIRVSTEEQAENGTSLADQRERGIRCAELRGAMVVRVFEDAGVSGARYETRPSLIRALECIERGEAELLIITKIDRLARKTKIVLEIAERIDRAGGQIVTCDGMEFGKTPTGKLMLAQFAAFAEFERDTIRERSLSGKQSRARQGVQPARSRSPFGYHIVTEKDVKSGLYSADQIGKYLIVETEADLVRSIYERYDGGHSLNAIVNWLTSLGIPTPKGANRWYASTVRTILENTAYKGEATFGKMETISGENLTHKYDSSKRLKAGKYYRQKDSWLTITIPTIISEEQWERCQRRLCQNSDEKKAIYGGNPIKKYPLTSLIRCPHCGANLSGTKKKMWGGSEQVRYYECRGYLKNRCSGSPSNWKAEYLEGIVLASLIFLNTHPEAIDDAIAAYDEYHRLQMSSSEQEQERERLKSELARLEQELSTVKRAMMAAIRAGLDEEDFASELKNIADKRKTTEGLLARLTPPPTPAKQPEKRNPGTKLAEVAAAIIEVLTAEDDECTPAEKQALIAQMVKYIVPTAEGACVLLNSGTLQFIDMHCVTRWSRLGNVWEGVSTKEVFSHIAIKPNARYVMVYGYDRGWSTNLPLEEFLREDCLFADTHDGEPIDLEHGGPLRLVIPSLYAWKSAKWVRGVELMEQDRAGFWERGGYHMFGDPWKEERFRDDW